MWDLSCLGRFPFCVNHLSHVLHWYGFSPVRDLSWVWRPPFWVKAIFTSSWLVWLLSCVGSHMHFYISFFEETTHHMFCSGTASGFFHVFVESLFGDTNLSHLLHCYNFSTVWDLLWTCRSLFWIIHSSHVLYRYPLSPVWDRSCACRFAFCVNYFSQVLHWYDLSPVWDLSCICRFLFSVKYISQVSNWYRFSLV